MKRAGKVCRDSQDLKSPGKIHESHRSRKTRVRKAGKAFMKVRNFFLQAVTLKVFCTDIRHRGRGEQSHDSFTLGT